MKRPALLAMAYLALACIPSFLGAQNILSRGTEEWATRGPRSRADTTRVAQIDSLRRVIDSIPIFTGPSDWSAYYVHEMRLARFGALGPHDCLLPTDSLAYADGAWPENAETQFVIKADGGTNVLYFEARRGGCSGASSIRYQQYFDFGGSTIWFRRSAMLLGSCSATPVREVTTSYYDVTTGALVSKAYSLVDSLGEEIPPATCRGPYHREPYVIGRTWLDTSNLYLRGLPNPPG
jgi:hypothetical protein